MNERISVVVPVYNSARYLRDCLESLRNQTIEQLQIILVDDGSTDQSGKLCDEFAAMDKRICVIHTPNRGVSAARNIALDIAEGRYVYFCDSDDVCDTNLLESLLRSLKKTDSDLCSCGYARFSEEVSKSKPVSEAVRCVEGKNSICMQLHNVEQVGGYLWNKLFLRDLIEADWHIRFREDIAILEDYIFLMEYVSRCNRMCCVENMLYNYRNNPTGALRQELSDRLYTQIVGREGLYRLACEKFDLSNEERFVFWKDLIIAYAVFYFKARKLPASTGQKWKKHILDHAEKAFGEGNHLNGFTWKEWIYIVYLYIAVQLRRRHNR